MTDPDPANSLNNPMRWSLRHDTANVQQWLHDVDDDVQRRVTEIEMRPAQGNIFVHWEVVDGE